MWFQGRLESLSHWRAALESMIRECCRPAQRRPILMADRRGQARAMVCSNLVACGVSKDRSGPWVLGWSFGARNGLCLSLSRLVCPERSPFASQSIWSLRMICIACDLSRATTKRRTRWKLDTWWVSMAHSHMLLWPARLVETLYSWPKPRPSAKAGFATLRKPPLFVVFTEYCRLAPLEPRLAGPKVPRMLLYKHTGLQMEGLCNSTTWASPLANCARPKYRHGNSSSRAWYKGSLATSPRLKRGHLV